MKGLSIFMALTMAVLLFSACGDDEPIVPTLTAEEQLFANMNEWIIGEWEMTQNVLNDSIHPLFDNIVFWGDSASINNVTGVYEIDDFVLGTYSININEGVMISFTEMTETTITNSFKNENFSIEALWEKVE